MTDSPTATSPRVGDQAPDFTLPSTGGGDVKRSAFRGDSVPTLKEFKAKLALRLDLLSDFKREVCRAYGTLMEDKFYSRRAYFLIDRQGRLAWKHVEAENKQRRQDDEILRPMPALG